MTNDAFRTPPEELRRLQEQIAEAKEALREILARLNQIERHARRVFPSPQKPRSMTDANREISPPSSSLNAAQALRVFDDLAETWRQSGHEAVEEQVAKFPPADLIVLARELGLPIGRPSKKRLTQKILGRVKESVLLSKNVNVTRPRS